MGETRPKPKLPKCLNYGLVSATIINLIHSDIKSNLNLENGMELSPENLILPDELYDLGLEAYEPNELVFKAVQNLELFFEDESNCKCHKKKDRICFEKIGFKNF